MIRMYADSLELAWEALYDIIDDEAFIQELQLNCAGLTEVQVARQVKDAVEASCCGVDFVSVVTPESNYVLVFSYGH